MRTMMAVAVAVAVVVVSSSKRWQVHSHPNL